MATTTTMAKTTTMATGTTMATATTMATTMVAEDDDKEVDGDGTRRSFWGGYHKGVVVEGVARAAKKAGSLSSLPSSESWASTTATRPSFRGGGDKGIACEGVVRAAKKAG